MRKITQAAVSAFCTGRSFNGGNTAVTRTAEGVVLTLFGNPIAARKGGDVTVTTAGHPTATTLERLRGLGAPVYRERGALMWGGEPWSGDWRLLVPGDAVSASDLAAAVDELADVLDEAQAASDLAAVRDDEDEGEDEGEDEHDDEPPATFRRGGHTFEVARADLAAARAAMTTALAAVVLDEGAAFVGGVLVWAA